MTKNLDPFRLALVALLAAGVALALRARFGGDWFEFAGFVTGVVAVYLVTRESLLAYPVGIANVLIYAYVFFAARLYADMTLQIFYFALQIQGWYQWARGGVDSGELRITRLPARHWPLALAAWAAGMGVYVPVVTHFRGASPLVDSFITVGSMLAQVLQNGKRLEAWGLWIFLNLVAIPLFVSRGLVATAVLYGVYLALALVGLASWRARMAAASPPLGANVQ